MRKTILIIILHFLPTIIVFCQNNYYPLRKDTVDIEVYNKLIKSLSKMYHAINQTNNNNLANTFVNIGNIYSRLGENADSVFAQIEYAYFYDSVTTCSLIRHFNETGTYNFRNNCKKLDSLRWLNWCMKCNTLLKKINNQKINKKSINTEISDMLNGIYKEDQKYRKDSTFTNNNLYYSVFSKKQSELDSINLLKIKEIINKYGYPGKKLVGEQSMTAFYVIQHANLATREEFLPEIKKAVINKDLSKTALILLLDRIYLDKYNTQIWGTQQIWDKSQHKYIPAPIDNSEDAQKIRKEIDAIE